MLLTDSIRPGLKLLTTLLESMVCVPEPAGGQRLPHYVVFPCPFILDRLALLLIDEAGKCLSVEATAVFEVTPGDLLLFRM